MASRAARELRLWVRPVTRYLRPETADRAGLLSSRGSDDWGDIAFRGAGEQRHDIGAHPSGPHFRRNLIENLDGLTQDDEDHLRPRGLDDVETLKALDRPHLRQKVAFGLGEYFGIHGFLELQHIHDCCHAERN